jgi:hypothetical protein
VDETGGSFAERCGNDEISLGGVTVDPNGLTAKISPFTVNSNFDDGEIQRYSPPRVFASFALPAFQTPRVFSAGFLLFEKDAGGMSGIVTTIVNKVIELIKNRKAAFAQKAVVASTNGTDAVATAIPVAAIWAAIKPFVIKFVLDQISSAIKDDLFPLQDVAVTLFSNNHTFNGSKTSPVQMVEFRAHDGVYQLVYDWELQ